MGDHSPAIVDRREPVEDRRARSRGGRRDGDAKRPWYKRRPFWLAAASLVYVGWRKIRKRV